MMLVNGLAAQVASDGFALLCSLVLAGPRDVFLADGQMACLQVNGDPLMMRGTPTPHGMLFEFID